MKDIKTFMIGFLSCACLFLLIGASAGSKNNENGRYQITSQLEQGISFPDILHTIIDTQTGKIIKRIKSDRSYYK